MDEPLGDPGYDLGGAPRVAARRRRRQRLRAAAVVLTVLAVGVGVLAGLDEIRERRADAVLPELAEVMSRLVEEHPQETELGAGGAGWSDAAAAFREEDSVDLPEVGVFVLADLAGRGPLQACVEQDPWLGGERLRCVPLDEPGAEPAEQTGGGWLHVLGPDSEFED